MCVCFMVQCAVVESPDVILIKEEEGAEDDFGGCWQDAGVCRRRKKNMMGWYIDN